MDSKKHSGIRWQDWGSLLLGAWLLVSPWVIKYPSEIPYVWWGTIVTGVVIIVFSGLAIYMPRVWEEGGNMIVSIWLMASPWVMKLQVNQAMDQQLMVNSVVTGVLLFMLSLWAIWEEQNNQKARQQSIR